MAGLAIAVDDLYRDVVLHPERWNEAAFADWLESVALEHETIERTQAKHLRAAVRSATRLQRFWADADADRKRAEPLWRARVDIAAGVPAWRPGLELAMIDLETMPSEDRFDDVRERFRVVNGTPWLEGTSFAEWDAARGGIGDAQ